MYILSITFPITKCMVNFVVKVHYLISVSLLNLFKNKTDKFGHGLMWNGKIKRIYYQNLYITNMPLITY
ncbi:hypothetical protein AOA61_25525 [Pseudomonas sp. 2995-1]|nr:hypothetical protein AOA61_25525 [Pseudomonas sp. 2995-1]